MKINILTAVFYPEIHPRAFRAYELAKEFAAQGHKVQILLLTRVLDFDYISLEKELGVKVHLLDFYSVAVSIWVVSLFVGVFCFWKFVFLLFSYCQRITNIL